MASFEDTQVPGVDTPAAPELESSSIHTWAKSTRKEQKQRQRDARGLSRTNSIFALDLQNLPKSRTMMDRLVLAPKNRGKAALDACVAISICYAIITYPANVAFTLDLWPEVSAAADALFVLDVVLNLFHGYYELGSTRLPVLDFNRVVANYARPEKVIPDLLGVCSLLFRLTLHPAIAPIQLLSLARIARLRRLADRYNTLTNNGTMKRVAVSLVSWVLVSHWIGCLFFLLGWPAMCSVEADTWVTSYWPMLRAACNETMREDPIHFSGIGGPSLWTLYVRSLYWALATTSSLPYGSSPTAVTDNEHLLAIVAQVCGAFISAVIFSQVAQLIVKKDAAAVRYEEKLDSIREFVKFHRVPPAIQAKLLGYHDLTFSISNGFDLQRIAETFPRNVQEDTFFFMYEHVVRQVPMFAATDNNFVRALVRMLKPQVLLEGDFAFRYGEMGDTMFFVQAGAVQIGMFRPSGEGFSSVYATVEKGSYFGELALFTRQRRMASARGLQDCILYALSNNDFRLVVDQHPHCYETIVDKALERLKQLRAANSATEARVAVVNEMTAMLREKHRRLEEQMQGTDIDEELHKGGQDGDRGTRRNTISARRDTGVGRKFSMGAPRIFRRDTGFGGRRDTGVGGRRDTGIAPTASRVHQRRDTGISPGHQNDLSPANASPPHSTGSSPRDSRRDTVVPARRLSSFMPGSSKKGTAVRRPTGTAPRVAPQRNPDDGDDGEGLDQEAIANGALNAEINSGGGMRASQDATKLGDRRRSIDTVCGMKSATSAMARTRWKLAGAAAGASTVRSTCFAAEAKAGKVRTGSPKASPLASPTIVPTASDVPKVSVDSEAQLATSLEVATPDSPATQEPTQEPTPEKNQTTSQDKRKKRVSHDVRPSQVIGEDNEDASSSSARRKGRRSRDSRELMRPAQIIGEDDAESVHGEITGADAEGGVDPAGVEELQDAETIEEMRKLVVIGSEESQNTRAIANLSTEVEVLRGEIRSMLDLMHERLPKPATEA